ncbi:MAG: HEAT repeat domain-containing protein, partial [Halonotius sp.]
EVADCLDSDIATIRHEAAKTLGEINTRGAIDQLRPAARRDEDDELRRIALEQLGTFPSSDVINTLTDGVTDENPEIQQAAASSLMELISSASFEESHTIREEVAEEIEALDADVIPTFVDLFADTHRTTIRRNTAWLLGRIGDSREEVVDHLLDGLSDDDFTTSQIAASSLARIGGRDIEDRLEEFIEEHPEGSGPRTRAEFVLTQITEGEGGLVLERTVEYLHVSEPDDYTRQKREGTESAIDEIGSEDTTAESATEETEAATGDAGSATEEPESAAAETESG